MKKSITSKQRHFLQLIQHFMAGIMAFIIIFAITGTNIIIDGLNGEYSFNLKEADRLDSRLCYYQFDNLLLCYHRNYGHIKP